jgi:hypothetical protein
MENCRKWNIQNTGVNMPQNGEYSCVYCAERATTETQSFLDKVLELIQDLHVWYNILLVIIIALVIVISLWFGYFRKQQHAVSRREYWWISVILVCSIFLAYGLGYFVSNYGYNNKLLYNYFERSAIINIFTLFGIGATFIGIRIAYKQFKMTEDRIEGYDKLYEEVLSLLNDGRKKKFLFMGPSILPGDIGYATPKNIEKYKKIIWDFALHNTLNELVFITLDKEKSKKIYTDYTSQIGAGGTTQKTIDFSERVREQLGDHIISIDPDKNDAPAVSTAYFFSNGITAIHATPFHYTDMALNKDRLSHNKKPESTLIGFKTTDKNLLKMLDNSFYRIKKGISKVEKTDQLSFFKQLANIFLKS